MKQTARHPFSPKRTPMNQPPSEIQPVRQPLPPAESWLEGVPTPAQQKQDGYAVAALATSLPGMVPIALVLAGIALRRIKRTGGRGKRLAYGALLVSLVHRGSSGPLQLDLSLEGFEAGAEARIESLTAPFPWSANTDTEPEAIVPVASTAAIENNRIALSLPLGSVMLLRIPPA